MNRALGKAQKVMVHLAADLPSAATLLLGRRRRFEGADRVNVVLLAPALERHLIKRLLKISGPTDDFDETLPKLCQV